MDKHAYKVEDVLKEKGVYVGPTVGYSMYPMLKDRRDTIIVRPKTQRLQPLDVALYTANGKYVLHRVIQTVDGGYVIRGDNCYADEFVPEDDVFGVLTEFYRKNKHILCTDTKYLRYAKKMVDGYPQRKTRYFRKIKFRKRVKKCLQFFGFRKNKKS